MAARYTIFDHTADLGVDIYGKTLPELFANASYAIFDLITDLSLVRSIEKRQVVVDGEGLEDLLVNYLREILYLFNGDGLLLKKYSIMKIDPNHLEGQVWGEPFDETRHNIHMEIKAVTYHQVAVKNTFDGWTGRIIFDV
jgi:SHS2 domain-containing protein